MKLSQSGKSTSNMWWNEIVFRTPSHLLRYEISFGSLFSLQGNFQGKHLQDTHILVEVTSGYSKILFKGSKAWVTSIFVSISREVKIAQVSVMQQK